MRCRAAVAAAVAARPEITSVMRRSGAEVFAQGLGGLNQDMRLTAEPWSFGLGSITCPTLVFQVGGTHAAPYCYRTFVHPRHHGHIGCCCSHPMSFISLLNKSCHPHYSHDD